MMCKKPTLVLKDDSGVVLVIALLMILVLSLIGLASSSSSTFEIKLSGNKRGATDAFYTADGGAQSVMADVTNFNTTTTGYADVVTSTLPVELQNESIDKKLSSPNLPKPASVKFIDPPQVTIYHTTVTRIPRGLGLSAISFEYGYYIVDSIGKDQMDLNLVKSNCEIREKIVRLVPTGQ